jgi:hypothetical protein
VRRFFPRFLPRFGTRVTAQRCPLSQHDLPQGVAHTHSQFSLNLWLRRQFGRHCPPQIASPNGQHRKSSDPFGSLHEVPSQQGTSSWHTPPAGTQVSAARVPRTGLARRAAKPTTNHCSTVRRGDSTASRVTMASNRAESMEHSSQSDASTRAFRLVAKAAPDDVLGARGQRGHVQSGRRRSVSGRRSFGLALRLLFLLLARLTASATPASPTTVRGALGAIRIRRIRGSWSGCRPADAGGRRTFHRCSGPSRHDRWWSSRRSQAALRYTCRGVRHSVPRTQFGSMRFRRRDTSFRSGSKCHCQGRRDRLERIRTDRCWCTIRSRMCRMCCRSRRCHTPFPHSPARRRIGPRPCMLSWGTGCREGRRR